jgi:hypothetical protein
MKITFYGKYETPLDKEGDLKLGMSLEKINNKLSTECKELMGIINRIPTILSKKPEWEGENLIWKEVFDGATLKATSIADLTYKFEITKNN